MGAGERVYFFVQARRDPFLRSAFLQPKGSREETCLAAQPAAACDFEDLVCCGGGGESVWFSEAFYRTMNHLPVLLLIVSIGVAVWRARRFLYVRVRHLQLLLNLGVRALPMPAACRQYVSG